MLGGRKRRRLKKNEAQAMKKQFICIRSWISATLTSTSMLVAYVPKEEKTATTAATAMAKKTQNFKMCIHWKCHAHEEKRKHYKGSQKLIQGKIRSLITTTMCAQTLNYCHIGQILLCVCGNDAAAAASAANKIISQQQERAKKENRSNYV